jgi:hypothetical protein
VPVNIHRILAAAAVVTIMAAGAAAQDVAPIFDLPLGKPLDRPILRCDNSNKDVGDYCGRFEAYPSARARDMMLQRPHPNDTTKKIPTWITQETIHVRLDDQAAIESILVTTVGPNRQAAVIESLTGRFGPPTASSTREAQNAYGTKWQVTTASWSSLGIHVFHGCSKINECYVRVLTPAAHERELAEFKARKEKDKL